MTKAPSIKEALKSARQFIENGVELGYIKMPDADTHDPAHETLGKIKAALATFQPDGERREAIARALHQRRYGKWYEGPCAPTDSQRECLEEADWLLASGLVQDEAGIRKDEREKLRNRLDSHLNDFLCGMKEGWDDSVSGFNDAWDVVRKVFDAAAIRSASDGGAET